MTTGNQNTGPAGLETLTPGEREAVNRVARRMLHSWEENGRDWEPVDLLRAINAGAAQVVIQQRELKGA